MNVKMTQINDICCASENLPVLIENRFDQSVPEEFQYTNKNVPSALYDSEDFDIQYAGCCCELGCQCSTANCMCIAVKSLGISHYGDRRDILSEILTDAAKQPPVFECNSSCSCDVQKCGNRVVQLGLRHRLSVTLMRDTGWGLTALEPIHKGSFVVEYAGEILHQNEARERTLSQKASDKNYIHLLREHMLGDTITTYVDPTHVGNAGRFINHSCDPNLVMIPVRIDNAVPHLALFAKKDIAAGEELSFHYSGGPCGAGTTETASRSAVVRKPCLCGASICVGFLPFDQTIFSD